MKILHITGEYPPFIQGGLGTYTKEVTVAQAEAGHEVTVLVLTGNVAQYQKEKQLKNNQLQVIFKEFERRDFSDLSSTFISSSEIISKFKLKKIVAVKPDVIHIHDWYGAVWGVALKYATGAKLVFTSHLPIRAGFTYTGHEISLKEKMQLESLAMRVADIVLAPSQSVIDILVNEYNVSRAKTAVLPNGINHQTFSPRLSQETKSPKLISVSRLSEQKGLFYLLDVMTEVKKELPMAKCLIVGEGPIKQALALEIKHLGLEKNVQLVGYKNHDELSQLYAEADLFLGTSIYEPFGLVILEALASALPVVAFSVGGVAEIMTGSKAGSLVAPGDCQTMADVVIKLLKNPAKLQKMKVSAVDHTKKYSWEIIVKKLDKIYHSL